MNAMLIVLGVALLIYPAALAMQLIGYVIYEILANNWDEYLFWPAIIALTGGGVWALLSGLGVV